MSTLHSWAPAAQAATRLADGSVALGPGTGPMKARTTKSVDAKGPVSGAAGPQDSPLPPAVPNVSGCEAGYTDRAYDHQASAVGNRVTLRKDSAAGDSVLPARQRCHENGE
jgi:hypothetical protein